MFPFGPDFSRGSLLGALGLGLQEGGFGSWSLRRSPEGEAADTVPLSSTAQGVALPL